MSAEPHRHHPETGEVILEEPEPPEDAQAKAMESAAKADAEAQVEIARVQADAAVQLAKIERSALDDEERIELEALREEVSALKSIVAPEPAPQPEPVVVAAPEENDIPADAPPEVEGSAEPKPHRSKAGLGMW